MHCEAINSTLDSLSIKRKCILKMKFSPPPLNSQFLTRKSSGAHQAKRRKEEKAKPEEHEGMPQHQHCPLEKRRGDRNPECHEEQQKDVA
jgi:hypothetical protein